MRAKRIVVKVGSSSLTTADGKLAEHRLQALAHMLAASAKEDDVQYLLVSSGAVAAGTGRLGWRRDTLTTPEKQAAAAVGQGLLMNCYEQAFRRVGCAIGQVLLTRSDIEDRKRFVHIRNTIETLLYHGIIPVVNENDTVAVDEIRFGDNDTLSAMVALLAQADLLVLLTDIDGFYTKNPRVYPDARRLSDIWSIEDHLMESAGGSGSAVGTGGMRTKVAAAKIAMDAGVDVVVASSGEAEVLPRLVRGEPIGTRFHANSVHLTGKKSWMLHGTRVEGTLVVDAGATRALTLDSGSLLFPGITAVEGYFAEGASVDIVTDEGRTPVARGIVNYSAEDLRSFLVKPLSPDARASMHAVVHRNEMVMLSAEGGEVYA